MARVVQLQVAVWAAKEAADGLEFKVRFNGPHLPGWVPCNPTKTKSAVTLAVQTKVLFTPRFGLYLLSEGADIFCALSPFSTNSRLL